MAAGDYILVAVIAYLCGSIPFGYILVRIFLKQDVRATGSGNIGATNVARAAPVLGAVTLILDALKGAVAILLTVPFDKEFMYGLGSNVSRPPWVKPGVFLPGPNIVLAVAVLFVVLGHLFPVWLRFRGGKGVATAVGAYLVVDPGALGVTFLLFAAVVLLTRYVSLGSIVAAVAFPIVALWLNPALPRALLCSFIAISVLIIAKHHANIRRLLNGTENKLGGKKIAEVTGGKS
jgi:acyl phosphate:glycerol-3-phosphate acyltransferase